MLSICSISVGQHEMFSPEAHPMTSRNAAIEDDVFSGQFPDPATVSDPESKEQDSTLRRQDRVHGETDSTPHTAQTHYVKCNACGYETSVLEDMLSHVKIHPGERNMTVRYKQRPLASSSSLHVLLV